MERERLNWRPSRSVDFGINPHTNKPTNQGMFRKGTQSYLETRYPSRVRMSGTSSTLFFHFDAPHAVSLPPPGPASPHYEALKRCRIRGLSWLEHLIVRLSGSSFGPAAGGWMMPFQVPRRRFGLTGLASD